MFRNTRLYSCITLAWILISLIARGAVAAPAPVTWCDTAFDLEPNTVWRGDAHFEEPTFRWLLPSSGIATVDLLAAGSAATWIDLRADACGEQSADVWVVEQSASHLVLAVRSAGQLYLTTGAKASAFRLITSFTQAEVVEEAFDLGDTGMLAMQTSFLVASPTDKTEPEVLDPEPDGLVAGDRLLASFLRLERATAFKTEPEVLDPEPDGLVAGDCHLAASSRIFDRAITLKTEPEVLDPEPDGLVAGDCHLATGSRIFDRAITLKTEPEVLDPEPDGFMAGDRGFSPTRRQVLLFEPICRRNELDDHGDTTSCATPLRFGRSVTGELTNDWSDDSDVFSFRLDRVSQVEIALVAEVSGLTYELSSSAGQRLAVDRLWTKEETDVHLASTLAPGRYFFRVTGAAGAYALTTMAID